ncbi:glycosyltransferase 61 family protein [Sandaracinus amylolyticus]|uniref:glycosyltransferase 61 family protein n=1 Tax=Sandaracinus amylolyticus TaxID=927083 RepID=UPI001F34DB03|nr:glycosyltransferase family 61 protein [Sandaracinus amylolyticus]UJR83842.1 Hypothetical protein I5071_59130 [Sandaracinus amylolyticus]
MFEPIMHRIRARLAGPPAITAAATEVIELHPFEEQPVSPAFVLPGQLQRATATHGFTTLPFELARVASVRTFHAPTLAMRFENAVLIDGVLFANGARHNLVLDRERLMPSWSRVPELHGVAFASSAVGSHSFGHFIAEDCATAHAAREKGVVYFAATRTPKSAHARRYLEIYGLAPLREIANARLHDVWVFQDFAMNGHKRARLHALRERVKAIPAARTGHGVFFRRRSGGQARLLANEAALEERLAKEGFDVIDVMQEDLDTILRRVRGASVVCGVEGSALMHGLFAMADGGAVVSIQPPHRFCMVLKDHADVFGHHTGIAVGIGTEESFELPERDLLRTLDLAWERVATSERHVNEARRAAYG